jgi:hypothetical protein
LYAVSVGALSPERARREIERWVEQQVQERLGQTVMAMPVARASELVDLDVFNAA